MNRYLIIVLIFGPIVTAFLVIYLIKVGQAKKLMNQATLAMQQGDERTAFNLYREALWKANEKPDWEERIIRELESLYSKYNTAHSLDDYKKLIEQFRVLSKKSSRKAMKKLVEVQDLKRKLHEKLPSLP